MSATPLRRRIGARLERGPHWAFALGAIAALLAMACGASPGPAPETGHAHDHDPAHGPLVHRFEHAEQWVPEFDDPARDAVRPALVPTDDPKLPAASVDRILIVDTWHHIPDREAYAAKLRSGLKVGGKVFVVDFKLDAKHGPPPHRRLAAEQVARELTAGALSARVATTSLPEQYVVVGARP